MWQIANVRLSGGGLAATHPVLKGEPYRDGAARTTPPDPRRCSSMAARSRSCAAPISARCRASWCLAVYIEAMFKTTNDADNRAAFAAAPTDALDFVGIACMARQDHRQGDQQPEFLA